MTERISLFFGVDKHGNPRQYARVTIPDGKPKFNAWFRKHLYDAQEGQCFYCSNSLGCHQAGHVDHFKPLKAGGGNEVTNLVLACQTCNLCKGSGTIETLRINLALHQSPIAGIINKDQALKLLDAGVSLPIEIDRAFWFEVV